MDTWDYNMAMRDGRLYRRNNDVNMKVVRRDPPNILAPLSAGGFSLISPRCAVVWFETLCIPARLSPWDGMPGGP
jgi:hypothetical protein